MNSTLTADTETEPSPEEIAYMRADMDAMWVEIEASNARSLIIQPEIERLRLETEAILDSLPVYLRPTSEELAQEKRERAQQIAELDRQIAEATQELVRLRQERDNTRRELSLPPGPKDFWGTTAI